MSASCFCNALLFLHCHISSAKATISRTPRGTPTPAPTAVSLQVSLLPVDGEVSAVKATVFVGETLPVAELEASTTPNAAGSVEFRPSRSK